MSEGNDTSEASPVLGGGADVGSGGGWSKSAGAFGGKDCDGSLVKAMVLSDVPLKLLLLGVRIPFLLGLSRVRCTNF